LGISSRFSDTPQHHTEHKKFGLAFVGFFYDFIWILQVAVNTQKGEESFCTQTLGKIEMLTVMPLVRAKGPRITWDLAMWPLGQRGRRGQPDSGEAGSGDGWEKVGEWSGGCR
jgi:hypothetical protein